MEQNCQKKIDLNQAVIITKKSLEELECIGSYVSSEASKALRDMISSECELEVEADQLEKRVNDKFNLWSNDLKRTYELKFSDNTRIKVGSASDIENYDSPSRRELVGIDFHVGHWRASEISISIADKYESNISYLIKGSDDFVQIAETKVTDWIRKNTASYNELAKIGFFQVFILTVSYLAIIGYIVLGDHISSVLSEITGALFFAAWAWYFILLAKHEDIIKWFFPRTLFSIGSGGRNVKKYEKRRKWLFLIAIVGAFSSIVLPWLISLTHKL